MTPEQLKAGFDASEAMRMELGEYCRLKEERIKELEADLELSHQLSSNLRSKANARIAALEGFVRMYLTVGHTLLAREAKELLEPKG